MNEKNRNRLDEELDLAQQVQQLLFPLSSPLCSWCCIGVKNRMVSKLGGDYFDFITMPDQRQSLFIGDVTGHGFHASVIMSLIYGYIHRATTAECSPCDIVNGINRFLLNFAQRTEKLDHYFSSTLFFASIEPNSLKMHYVNCAQTPPLVKRNNEITTLQASGPPLGFFEKPDIELQTFQFQPGDRFLLYTDGMIEARNQQGDMFGEERLREGFRVGAGEHIELLDELFERVEQFCHRRRIGDDMTAILLDFHRPFSTY